MVVSGVITYLLTGQDHNTYRKHIPLSNAKINTTGGENGMVFDLLFLSILLTWNLLGGVLIWTIIGPYVVSLIHN